VYDADYAGFSKIGVYNADYAGFSSKQQNGDGAREGVVGRCCPGL
jgi:hypothetical protein